ncbi:voltage-gated potassium channel [Krasilnikovia cinnamomea]|uniref:Voltage-gated potassium channel n=1 Tax=Krasilnikovia cinnamomea TaxID=349313 RepID=A0A4Q7ZFP2_9ACTN|nr:potassium channel family protein [Krasilnikovia cinnamomea]RZU49567.1 voltage-gated potassium channel [Krasilnikovia cinnamomea]
MRLLLSPFRAMYRGLVFLANSPGTLILAYVMLLAVGGLAYSLVEEGKTFGDSLWWAVVTATTVGYGDEYPKTLGGRVIAGLLISVMVLAVIPLITAHFASRLIVDTDAFRHEEQEELKSNLRRVRVLLEELAAREGVHVPETVTSPGSADPPGARSGR